MTNSDNNEPRAGWAQCGFNDIADVVMGQSPPSSTYNKDGQGLPFFQGKAEFQDIYPSIEKYCTEPNKIAQKGAVLMSVRAPVGPTNVAPDKCCIGRGLAAFHPLGGITTSYLLYLIRSIERELAKDGTGTTFSAINKQYIEEVRFTLPPLNEQHRIVAKIEELFSELDKGIESLKTAREQLKVYRQALLKHAFEGKLTEQWRTEHADELESAEQLLERIKQEREARYQQQLEEWKAAVKQWEADGKEGKKPRKPKAVKGDAIEPSVLENLPKLPSGWLWVPLSHLTDLIAGNAFKKSEYSDSGVRLFQIANVSFGEIVWDKIAYLPEGYLKAYPELRLSENDLVMALNRPLLDDELKIGILSESDAPSILYQRVGKFELFDDSYGRWIFNYLRSPVFISSLKQDLRGVNIPFINQTKLLQYPIPFCISEERSEVIQELEKQVSNTGHLIADIERQIRKAEALRQSILKKAFSGQLVPQDPDDEPASVLLDRIAKEKEEAVAKAKKAKAAKKKQVTRKAS